MSRLHPVRIIAGPEFDPAFQPPAVTTRRGDYAALLRRGRAARPAGRRTADVDERHDADDDAALRARADEEAPLTLGGADADDSEDSGRHADGQPPQPPRTETAAPRTAYRAAEHSAADTHEPTPDERLQEMSLPYVDALADQQNVVNELAEFLLERVADFCTDDAVLSQGNWEIRLKLDPAVLPECTLYLRLSHFDLTLRFETASAKSKRLVSDHGELLKNRLEALLQSQGVTRDVAILVT